MSSSAGKKRAEVAKYWIAKHRREAEQRGRMDAEAEFASADAAGVVASASMVSKSNARESKKRRFQKDHDTDMSAATRNAPTSTNFSFDGRFQKDHDMRSVATAPPVPVATRNARGELFVPDGCALMSSTELGMRGSRCIWEQRGLPLAPETPESKMYLAQQRCFMQELVACMISDTDALCSRRGGLDTCIVTAARLEDVAANMVRVSGNMRRVNTVFKSETDNAGV